MAAKKHTVIVTRDRVTIIEQPMIGPEPGGIQFCIRCNRSILNGDRWRMVWAADGSYAVGVHDRCHQLAQADAAR
jgi:hypothetical protein